MPKSSVLILFSYPFFPDGSPDKLGIKSVKERLRAVQSALKSEGYKVSQLEVQTNLSDLIRKILEAQVDVVFNLCEEFAGKTSLEMNVAAILELLNIPFTGSSAFVLGLTQDKGKTKSILAHAGIPTPNYQICYPAEEDNPLKINYPLIVKPLREDASLGIDNESLVKDENSLKRQIKKIHQHYGQPALLEEYIEGRELNVSIIGNTEPRALPISEIDFSSLPPELPKICGYAAKWEAQSLEFRHTLPICPAPLSPELEKKVVEISLKVYQIMECRDYARVDIRLDAQGTPYVLEVNANPDISPDAGLIRSAKAAGFTYEEFIAYIVELAKERRPHLPPMLQDHLLKKEKDD
ncbi:MAG: D-alanine--D-alanine ligase family protein [Thermodesulfobacteriota bacterium]